MKEFNWDRDLCSFTAQVSENEVDTPIKLVKTMFDVLPHDIWSNPNITICDFCVKSGRFLLEAYFRFLDGEKDIIPDFKERRKHILEKQIFGLGTSYKTQKRAIANLYAGQKFSNIKYIDDLTIKENVQDIDFKEVFNMNFDIIIGNPPYQQSDGGAQASAVPLYNLFIEKAKQLNPRYLSMIIPDRWITGGRGLDSFRNSMLNDTHFSYFYDYANSKDCFPNNVDIKGGICYFLWDNQYNEKCKIIKNINGEEKEAFGFLNEPGIFSIGFTEINNKVSSVSTRFIEDIASTQKPYGIRGDAFANPEKYNLPPFETIEQKDGYKIIGRENNKRVWKYLKSDFNFSKMGLLTNYKVFIPRNFGSGKIGEMPPRPIIASPNECCTETFIEIGPFNSAIEAQNFLSYYKTKFFRALMSIQKKDQSGARRIYKHIPIQDFSKPWTDKELYEKYKLTDDEIAYIEENIPNVE